MYNISKNDDGTSSAIYQHSSVSGDIIVTYVPGKDYYMIGTTGPRSARWIVPSDLLDALYNAAWEAKNTPNEEGLYYCPSHGTKQNVPCEECLSNKKS